MPSSIIGIPTTRVSDLFIRQRLLNQVQSDQAALFRVMTQLSTGRAFEAPSENPVASQRVASLQSLLERKEQVMTNLTTNQSFLSATESAVANVSSLLAEVRGLALGVLGTTATDIQRDTAVQQIDQLLEQLIDTGNQQFRGRYLFAGSLTTTRPFSMATNDVVEYAGNEDHLASYADVDLLFQTNFTGAEMFGAVSDPVRGSVDLNPTLQLTTRLADLRGGQGISRGSIAVSDGLNTSIVDLSTAETIGDLAALIKANPPPGREVFVDVTPSKLVITLDPTGGGALSIREVGGGTVANELGIRREIGQPTPIVGRDLDPILRKTTALANCFGARATASVHSIGPDNDIIIEANLRGAALADGTPLNGVTVRYVGDVAMGAEYVEYTPGSEIVVHVAPSHTEARQIVDLINAVPNLPFTARLDPLDNTDGGKNVVQLSATGVTAYGAGTEFDKTSGLQILNRGQTYTIDFTLAQTIEDLLNTLNGAGAGLLAEINAAKTGIDVRSRASGCDFAIGENGGTTAAQLGLRTFTEETRLEDLNHGRGVNDWPGYTGTQAQATFRSAGSDTDITFTAKNRGFDWNDFTIRFIDTGGPLAAQYDPVAKTIVFEINQGVTTANDIVGLVANHEQIRLDWEATLDPTDGNTGKGKIGVGEVTTTGGSDAGTDFVITRIDGVDIPIDISGLETIGQVIERINTHPLNTGINDGSGSVADTSGNVMSGDGPASYSSATVRFSALRADLVFTARSVGSGLDGTDIIFVGTPGGPLGAVHDPVAKTLTITYDNTPGSVTTANQIVDFFDGNTTFAVALAQDDAPGSLQAQLAQYGNGIMLVDRSAGSGKLTVTRDPMSTAAIDLGLIPEGQTSNSTTSQSGISTARLVSSSTVKSNLIFRADDPGTDLSGLQIILSATAPPGPSYNETAKTLIYGITPGVTTAQMVMDDINAHPVLSGLLTVELDPDDDIDGRGRVAASAGNFMAGGPGPGDRSTVTVVLPGTDNDLIFTAVADWPAEDGTAVVFDPSGPPFSIAKEVGPPRTLRITFDPANPPTAADIVAAMAADADFLVQLDPADRSPNGAGLVDETSATLAGAEQTLVGADRNPLETEGIYTALLRIRAGLQANNIYEVQRSIDMLDRKTVDLNFVRGELGARQQGLEVLQGRLDSEEIELRQVLSLEYDVPIEQVVSELTARQAAYEASLRAMGSIFQMSLLNYL